MPDTYNADTFTAGPAPAIHAGVNTQICNWTMARTSSGVVTANLTPLPAGAEVTNVRALASNVYGTGGEIFSVYATIGGTRVQTFIGSASWNQGTGLLINANNQAVATADRWMAKRFTASANVVMVLSGNVGTGTASCDFAVIIDYLTRKRGD